MVKVKISISGVYNKRVLDKKDTFVLEAGKTIQDLLNEINRRYHAGITPNCIDERKIVCVFDEEIIQKEDLTKEIQKDGELSIMQPIAGG